MANAKKSRPTKKGPAKKEPKAGKRGAKKLDLKPGQIERRNPLSGEVEPFGPDKSGYVD